MQSVLNEWLLLLFSKQGFSKETELQISPCASRADSAAIWKAVLLSPGYSTSPPPTPPTQLQSGVYLGSCRSAHPTYIRSQASTSTPPVNHATWLPSIPKEPSRAVASQHMQGSHMLARPLGMQACVLPWHGAHSWAQLEQCVAWQMAAGWGPGGE